MSRADEARSLERALLDGHLGRRDFIRRAAALGLSAAAISTALAACGGTTSPTTAPVANTPAAGGGTTPAATTAAPGGAATAAPTRAASPAAAAAGSPAAAAGGGVATASAGPGPSKRGGGGTLKIIQSQAMTILNVHLSSGTKDDLVCDFFYEPLIRVNEDGAFIPTLAEAVPSQENGGLAADGKSATWKLKKDVKWSDGKPFTADDVVFTWEYATDDKTAATTKATYETVDKVEKVDDLTVRFTFKEPNPGWFVPGQALVIPRHVFEPDKGPNSRTSPNNLKPVGTGPYKLDDFKPGDVLLVSINDNYRDPNKPFFDKIEVKGGGDATSAARAVLQTGDYDYAWNLQVEDTLLRQLEGGGKGIASFTPGGGIERIFINFTDPNKEDPETQERSSLKFKHPFFTDPKVRQAFALGCDRDTIVKSLYGRAGAVAINILEEPPIYNSPNTTWEFSVDKGNALLEEAGWRKSGQYRAKDGVQMSVIYQTTVNSIRQKTQQFVKDGWEKMGIRTELKSVDSGVFFSSDAGNPDTSGKMYCDVQMYTTSAGLDPQAHMRRWTTEAAQKSQKAGTWTLGNNGRYINPEYDKLWEQAKSEMDQQKRAQLFIKMNDILIQDVVMIPLVSRKSTQAQNKALQNVNGSPWEDDYWNIANWVKG
jgi:peptide/nickel transport system substrate-binding protein